jgi:hypothetical protein
VYDIFKPLNINSEQRREQFVLPVFKQGYANVFGCFPNPELTTAGAYSVQLLI